MKNQGIASFLFLQLLLLSTTSSATNDISNKSHQLARLLLQRIAKSSSSSNHLGFLRRLAGGRRTEGEAAAKREFGPGADWSCSAEANAAIDYDSCTLSNASNTAEGGCSWCPLGSTEGVCLRAGQAAVINGLENEHLLHLKCYKDADTIIDEEATAFWDEAMSCLPHSREDCGGKHGDHSCTYCSVKDPAMGLCLSVDLWDNLVVAQAMEEFDEDVSTRDYIALNQVISCSAEPEGASDAFISDDSLWSSPCGVDVVEDVITGEACLTKDGCAIGENIFPGFLGSKSGLRCMSIAQEQAMVWAIELLLDMGWKEEMDSYQ
jgi:hypothetical protein